MAIQIQYPFINAVSVSMSISRGAPSKLFVVGGEASGFPFFGKKIGSGVEVGVGRNFAISEYIDNSVYLDQNNIILFRRGMPYTPVIKTKEVVVPIITITGSGVGATVQFRDVIVKSQVERMKGVDTLGEEDWADSPCQGSQVRYSANKALGIIGAPTIGQYFCSYEGQYRAVLSSIYADVGCVYWWNFTVGGLGKICASGGGDYGTREGCNIISSVSGKTEEGSRSHSSFTYQSAPTEEIRSVSFTKVQNSWFTTQALVSVKFPTFQQMRRMIWPSIDDYDDLSNGLPPRSQYLAISTLNLPRPNGDEETNAFNKKFPWDYDKSAEENWAHILNFPTLRKDTWGSILEGSEDIGNGILYLVKNVTNRKSDLTSMEIFYPYDDITVQYPTSYDSNANSLKVIQVTEEISPSASARGYNFECGTSTEDMTGEPKRGLWRSGQIDEKRNIGSEEEEEALGKELQEALSDCVLSVNAAPFQYMEELTYQRTSDNSTYKSYLEGKIPNTWPFLLARGFSIIWVRPPRRSVFVGATGGRSINCNDLREVIDYVDPNILAVSSPKLKEQGNNVKLAGVCDSGIQEWLDKYGVLGGGDNQSEVSSPGLLHAMGDDWQLKCGGYSKRFVMPTRSSYKVNRTLTVRYQVQAKMNAGGIGEGVWVNKGDTRGGGLNHTVSVSDMSELKDGGDYASMMGSVGASSVGYAKYVATDFCCPINGMLESLSANIGPDGVSVAYSYRGLAPTPRITQISTHLKGQFRGSVTV